MACEKKKKKVLIPTKTDHVYFLKTFSKAKSFAPRPGPAKSLVFSLTQGAQNPGMETTTRGGTSFRKPNGLEERGETENVQFFFAPRCAFLVWLGRLTSTPRAKHAWQAFAAQWPTRKTCRQKESNPGYKDQIRVLLPTAPPCRSQLLE